MHCVLNRSRAQTVLQAGLEEILFLVAQGCALRACESEGRVHTTLEVMTGVAAPLLLALLPLPKLSLCAMPLCPSPVIVPSPEQLYRTCGRTPFSIGQTSPTCMWLITIFVHRCANARHPPEFPAPCSPPVAQRLPAAS